jgi:hypothetical protein
MVVQAFKTKKPCRAKVDKMKCFQWVEIGKKMELVINLSEGCEIEYCQEQYKNGELFVLVGLLVDMEPVIVRITPRPYGASLQVEVRGVEYNPMRETSEELEKFIYERISDTVK